MDVSQPAKGIHQICFQIWTVKRPMVINNALEAPKLCILERNGQSVILYSHLAALVLDNIGVFQMAEGRNFLALCFNTHLAGRIRKMSMGHNVVWCGVVWCGVVKGSILGLTKRVCTYLFDTFRNGLGPHSLLSSLRVYNMQMVSTISRPCHL